MASDIGNVYTPEADAGTFEFPAEEETIENEVELEEIENEPPAMNIQTNVTLPALSLGSKNLKLHSTMTNHGFNVRQTKGVTIVARALYTKHDRAALSGDERHKLIKSVIENQQKKFTFQTLANDDDQQLGTTFSTHTLVGQTYRRYKHE